MKGLPQNSQFAQYCHFVGDGALAPCEREMELSRNASSSVPLAKMKRFSLVPLAKGGGAAQAVTGDFISE